MLSEVEVTIQPDILGDKAHSTRRVDSTGRSTAASAPGSGPMPEGCAGAPDFAPRTDSVSQADMAELPRH